MFALSLSWNANKYKTAKRQIDEVIQAGFRAVELNFSLRENQVNQIHNLAKNGLIKIVSCHNFCPIPPGLNVKTALPDWYSLASLQERKRRLALKYTKRSIDTASRLKAGVLILHCGRVEIPDRSKQLMHLFLKVGKDSPCFKSIAAAMRQEREKAKRPYLEKAFQSISELAGYAKKSGVKLALENRIYYSEIPQLEELAYFLNNTDAFFWFDTGHAYIMEKLWSVNYIHYLQKHHKKLVGIHLHDINRMQDHLAPGKGEFAFYSLKPFIKGKTLKVIEAHAPATRKELIQSVKVLNKAFN